MADQGTIGYDACTLGQGEADLLLTQDSIVGGFDACTLGQGEADLLLTQDSIVGGFDACTLGQGILVHSVAIAWTES